jgi:multiple sugar transport system substrate-binding protein
MRQDNLSLRAAKGLNDYRSGAIDRRTLLKILAAGGLAAAGVTLYRRRTPSLPALLPPADELGPASALLPETDAHRFLKEAGRTFAGRKIRIVTEDTPPSQATRQLVLKEFVPLTGIEVNWELLPLDQVLAKILSDTARQAGAFDLFYLDQAWIGQFAGDCDCPAKWVENKDLAYPGYGFSDFLPPLIKNISTYQNRLCSIPYDIPIFIPMYRKDLFEKLGLSAPSTLDEWMNVCQTVTREMAPQVFGSTAQWRAGHYALHCNMTSWLWAHGGSVFGPGGQPAINDAPAHAAMEYMLKLSETMPPGVTNWDWHDESRCFARGQAAIYASWGEFFPIYDDPARSKIVGLAEPAPAPREKALRTPGECSFGETPGICHQGGSSLAISRYSRNPEAAWVFLQWATSADVTVRASIMGGGASLIRRSTYDDPRIKSRARVGPGTTRHLPVTLDAILNRMGTEPHFAGWEDLATDSFAVELGRMITRQQSVEQTLTRMAQAAEKAVSP